MADLTHSASRDIDQRPDVVHARLLELAERLRQEAPPVPAGSQPAMLLGIDGPLGIETIDRGPSRIELRTTRGRVRGEGSAVLAALDGGTRTTPTMSLAIKPQGFAANLMLGAALATMPDVQRQVVDGLERGLDDLAIELAKPDAAWDPDSWTPQELSRRS